MNWVKEKKISLTSNTIKTRMKERSDYCSYHNYPEERKPNSIERSDSGFKHYNYPKYRLKKGKNWLK